VTQPQPLAAADLLAWAVVLGYRAQQQRDGLRYVLMPFPPCPTCRGDVHTVNMMAVESGIRQHSRLTVQPCGHTHIARDDDVDRIRRHIDEMLDLVERADNSRDPDVHGWTTGDVAREAQVRVGPEPSNPTQCSGEEGFCPEHGFHRHCLKQPGEADQTTSGNPSSGSETADSLRGQLQDARLQIARVRKVIAERRLEVAEREADGMLPFGTPGASWCDAVTVTCSRVEDALRAFPPPGGVRAEPADDAGPTVQEVAAADRRWDLEKTGE
jgi:hypothetical protein